LQAAKILAGLDRCAEIYGARETNKVVVEEGAAGGVTVSTADSQPAKFQVRGKVAWSSTGKVRGRTFLGGGGRGMMMRRRGSNGWCWRDEDHDGYDDDDDGDDDHDDDADDDGALPHRA
jgi:hypothetical protein